MAIYHFSASFPPAYKSPVASAAYRHRTTMKDTVRGDVWSYSRTKDLVHAEIVAPANAPRWLVQILANPSVNAQSAALWNTVLAQQTRVDGQTARDIDIALPIELTREEHIALVRDFVATTLTARGVVVDWAYHDKGDGNPHIHLMHTLRPLADTGFGRKTIPLMGPDGQPVRAPSGKIVYRHFVAGNRQELIELRQAWAETANKHLALAGHDIRISAASFIDLGIAIPPTTHLSPTASAIARSDRDSAVLARVGLELRGAAAAIIAKPDQLLAIVAIERSTFTRADIARALNRFVHEPRDYVTALANVMASPELVLLKPATSDDPREIYSTRALIALEQGMAYKADLLATTSLSAISLAAVDRAIKAVETKDKARTFTFSPEQVAAVRHVTAPAAIASVIGMAGAGKSTLLEAANRAWTQNGQRVVGAALAGKAAEGLEQSSGIPSRTITAWLNAWDKGYDHLRPGDVFVLDEAGMVASTQMAALVDHVHQAGAKIVLVGDPVQLQPIEAGAAFRAISDRIGPVTLADIRRQSEPWQRDASQAFATGRTAEALAAYDAQGCVRSPDTTDDALRMLVSDWTDARSAGSTKPADLLVLAQTNADVLTLNRALRAVVAAEGGLSDEIVVETARGARAFAVGDRILCLRNARFPDPAGEGRPEQTVKNGMLGTVASTAGGMLTVALDAGRTVTLSPAVYNSFDHGYATTIHKAQGVTVERAFVLVSAMMDRHLAYVGMTRHKTGVTLYAPKDIFLDRADLARALGRDHQKSTTLDYKDVFASRRGLDTLSVLRPDFVRIINTAKHALFTTWDRLATAFNQQLSAHRQKLTFVHAALSNAPTQLRPDSLRSAFDASGSMTRRPVETATPARSTDALGDRPIMTSDTPSSRLINPARAYQLENGTNVLAFGYDRQAVSLVAAQNVAGQPKTYEWDKSKGAYVSAQPADPKLVAALNARLDVADAHARLALQVIDGKAAIGAGVTVKRDGADLIVKFAKNEQANKLLTGLRGTEQSPGQAVQWDKFANGYRVGVTSAATVTTTINKLNEISTTLAKQELSAAQSAHFSNPSSLVHTTIKDGKIVASFQKDPIANGFAKDAGGAYTKGTYVFSPATDTARTAVVEAMVKIDQHFNTTYLLAPGPATAEGRGADGIAPPSPEIAAVIAMPSEERLAALSANLDLADSVEAYNRQITAVLNKHPDLQAAVQAGDRDAVTNLGLNNDQAQDLIQAFQDTTYALEDVKTQMMEQAQGQTQAQTPAMAM